MTKEKLNNNEFNKYLRMLKKFKKSKILVIGDVMLDEYMWGSATRISPEAPVPVVEIKNRTFNAGGAANTVFNIITLGAQAWLMGIVGSDPSGKYLRQILREKGISTDYIITDGKRPTTTKVRILAQGQQVMRTDQEMPGDVGKRISNRMIKDVAAMIDDLDGIAISDYNKGVITPLLMSELINIAKEKGKVIAADIKPSNIELFKGVTLVTPNRFEAQQMSGIKIRDDATLLEAGRKIKQIMGSEAVLITLGGDGMALFTNSIACEKIPALSTDVYDVTGAGDTVLAAAALGLSTGHSMSDSIRLANYAAGVVVRKRGTAAVSQKELIEFIRGNCG
ncbi:MAG TPA: D-glycero-beta-D-manno-heptose-7-phosphate kinase [bacterium]|nr:D-glycero-beta-D-manno-heptose-7-phosphate kinase [bacterium]